MKIALIGYGKMGKSIEKFARERNHEISFIIDIQNYEDIHLINSSNTDVAIEFTTPHSAIENLTNLINQKVNTVCGTTGWTDQKDMIYSLVKKNEIGFLWSSNFSIGVNIFFLINEYISQIMNHFPQYHPSLEEIHHIHKKDAPSGTAITLAEGIISKNQKINSWILGESTSENVLSIKAIREGEVPGTHIIEWNSTVDTITIAHKAKSREGFALGAVLAAEFLCGKKGIFSMRDVLSLKNI